jgi:LAS superfamily LD-carboxypeptidase LdcB
MTSSSVHFPVTLTAAELTGRAATHVREVPELGTRLHVNAIAAVARLREAARTDGIDLEVVSGFRDFARQCAIWNGKFRGERPLLDREGRPLEALRLDEAERVEAILLWSALPGASRHHWGTDFDVIDRAAVPADYRPQLTQAEFAEGGPFASLNAWLDTHLARFGFFRPYTTDRGGVHPEPWHLSYAPLSVPALEALSLDVLYEAVEQSDLLGREHVLTRLPEIHARYVLAIDPPP